MPGTSTKGSLLGVYRKDGREQLITTFGANSSQAHYDVLSHAVVSWLTRGVSLSFQRNWFSVHSDDVLLPDSLWSPSGNCTIGDDCDPAAYPETSPEATARMTSQDVSTLTSWQRQRDFTVDQAFNADGSVQHSSNNFGVDSLRASLKLDSGSMRFINHTYSHAYLGCVKDTSVQPWRCATDSSGAVKWVSANTISSEISRNISWVAWNFVPIDSGELVTGEHSGLRSLPQMSVDNPNLASALNSNGIKWIASDASRERETRPIGRTRTVPRYPMNIFYNATTTTQEVDEDNWIYTTRANGGSGLCEDNPTISTCIEPLDL